MDKIKVLVVPKEKDTKNTQRVIKPHLFLQDKFEDDFFVDIDYEPNFEDKEWLKQYDIVIYHEYLDEDGTIVEKFKDLGIIGILDIQTNWAIPKNSPFYKYVKHQEDMIKRAIRNAQYITTSTEPLYHKIISISPDSKVFLVPDGIDTEEKQWSMETKPSKKVRLGWIADNYSMEDTKILEGLVSKLKSEKVLDDVQIVLCGFDLESYKTQTNEITGQDEKVKRPPKETTWYQYEKILTHNYTTVTDAYRKYLLEFTDKPFAGVENEPYKRVWTKPTNKYGEYYSEFDITLAPMEVNSFNETLSPFKVMESGFYKKPIIAQDYGVYGDILTNAYQRGGELDLTANALMVNPKKNHKEWVKYIKKLVQDRKAIQKLGENLHLLAFTKFQLNNITNLRKHIYEKVVKQRK